MALEAGDIVRVPLGSREVFGVVWGPGEGATDTAKIKPVQGKCDVPPIPPELRAFVDWVAAYVMAPPGAVLRQLMRVPAAFEPPKPVVAYQPGETRPARLTDARARVFAALEEMGGMSAPDLARAAQVSGSVVKGLIESGHLMPYNLPGYRPFPAPDADHAPRRFSDEQETVVATLRDAVASGQFSTHLIDGVTGSGKTEVYFEAIAEALRAGRQALILLPEISLTAQFLSRFEARFGVAPALWHSGLGPSERRRTWREIAENRVQVLVGARSALFLPWRDLGVIIVDEEHDGGFKQEDGVIYNARDMAVVRGRLAACPVVLASATPSLRAMSMVARAAMSRIAFMGVMVAPICRKSIWLICAPTRRPRGLDGFPMIEAVGAAMERGEQALLFLNRRGYAPLTLCRACGHRYACEECDAWMVEHRFRKQLQCHHCGRVEPVPHQCSACGELEQLAACGPGVERVTEEIIGHYPKARVAVLSSDYGGAALREVIDQIARGEADIIVGTQIVAKDTIFQSSVSSAWSMRIWASAMEIARCRTHLSIIEPSGGAFGPQC